MLVVWYKLSTSMILVVSDPINSSQKLNKNLHKVGLCTNKWTMSFNPDQLKQAQQDKQDISPTSSI